MNDVVLLRCSSSDGDAFTLNYCRQFWVRHVTPYSWTLCGEEVPLSFFAQGAKACGVIAAHADVILTKDTVAALVGAASSKAWDVLVPCLGGADQKQAPSELPFDYVDEEGFCEAVRWCRRRWACRVEPVQEPDFCVVWLSIEVLHNPLRNLPWSRLQSALRAKNLRLGLARGALAHSFGRYRAGSRLDLLALWPGPVMSVLDVGCGEGGFGRELKQRGLVHGHLAGVEPDERAARQAQAVYDEVHVGPVESYFSNRLYDVMVLGDVLEHLKDPAKELRRLRAFLRPSGLVVGSCPNAAHWSVVHDLVHDRFSYVPAGILCWDHLRFFTARSLRELLEQAGFYAVRLWPSRERPAPHGERFLQSLKPWVERLDHLTVVQWLFTASKAMR